MGENKTEMNSELIPETEKFRILQGNSLDVLKTLPDESVDCCVTSPPYYALRGYTRDLVQLKKDAPSWIISELAKRGILPK